MSPLTAAIGRYHHTAAAVPRPTLGSSFPVISRPSPRWCATQRFDVSEMAIATFLMARAAGSDLVLLPVAMAARFQNGALLRRAADAFGPGDLAGRRIGVRAYSQTTGLWLRGILQEEHGLAPGPGPLDHLRGRACRLVSGPALGRARARRVGHAGDAARRPAGRGNLRQRMPPRPTSPPSSPTRRRPAEPSWRATVSCRSITCWWSAPRLPGPAARCGRCSTGCRAAGNPFPSGRAALDPAVSLALRYAAEQGLLARPLTLDEVWAGLPRRCEEVHDQERIEFRISPSASAKSAASSRAICAAGAPQSLPSTLPRPRRPVPNRPVSPRRGLSRPSRTHRWFSSASPPVRCWMRCNHWPAAWPRARSSSTSTASPPATKQAAAGIIEAAGGRYVEAAVMASVPPKRLRTPILLGGPHAAAFMRAMAPFGMDLTDFGRNRPRIIGQDVPQRDDQGAWRR